MYKNPVKGTNQHEKNGSDSVISPQVILNLHRSLFSICIYLVCLNSYFNPFRPV